MHRLGIVFCNKQEEVFSLLSVECCFVLFAVWLHATRKARVDLTLIQVNVHTLLCQWKVFCFKFRTKELQRQII